MKNIICIIVLSLIACKSFCRDSYKDSLVHALARAQADSSRLTILISLTSGNINPQPDSALNYGYQAIGLSQKLGNKKAEAQLFFYQSLNYAALGNITKATEMSLKGFSIANKIGDTHIQANILNSLAVYYQDAKDYKQSLQYFRRALPLYEAQGEKDVVFSAMCLNGIAGIYLQWEQLDSALYYNAKAFKKWNDVGVNNPGNRAYKSNGFIFSRILFNRAGIETKKKNYPAAIQNLKEGLFYEKSFNPDNIQAGCELARVFLTIHQPDSAILYARQSLSLAEGIHQYNGIAEAGNLLATIYQQQDPQQAILYQQKVIAAYDSAITQIKGSSIKNLVGFDEQQRQYEIAAATAVYQNQVRQYALLSGIGILLLIAVILYRNNRQRRKANAVLQKTLTELQSTQAQLIQSEKMASLGQLTAGIAHEIQNPLNFVNNFSEVNNELIDELKEEAADGNYDEVIAIANDIKGNEQKIIHHGKRAESIVKGMLQHSRINTGKKELTNINTLVDESLRLSYHGLRAKNKDFNSTINTSFDDSIGNINIVPQDITRVLLNLLNNAFYAVNEKKQKLNGTYEPMVSVCTKKLDGKVEIQVKDNGNGIPQNIVDKIFQPFFTTKPTGQGTGLGLSLSYDIIKAQGGEINVESKEGKGTEFIVKLRL